jgi:4-hydroxyphenylacetate 3-monooxygenase oxygenase component
MTKKAASAASTYVPPLTSAIPSAKGEGAYTGQRYLDSLRDDRVIWYKGEKITDVTTHPLFSEMAHEIARIYDLQHAPETRDVMTFETEEGRRVSRSFQLPMEPADLLSKRANTQLWCTEVKGMCGRLPDFCAAMTIGFYDLRNELAKLNPDLAKNTEAYYHYARDNDICISHALHDPCMDKSLRPSQDPDRCLRVVEERDDGIVVRGARFNTFGPFSNEIVISPTVAFTKEEEEFAIWFTVRCDAPGLSQMCREIYSGRSKADHPMSARYDEIDTVVIFDDVFIPWERVFLYKQPLEATRLFRGGVMMWATYCGSLLTQTRMEFLIAVAHLLAETSGVHKRPEIIAALGEMCMNLKLMRSSLRAAEVDSRRSATGLLRPATTPERRALVANVSERFINLIQQIGTSSIIFLPMEEDWDNPTLKKYLDRWWRGRQSSPEDRYKICKLAWELAGDAYGARQQMYERLHSGDPANMVAGSYRNFDLQPGLEMVSNYLDLETPLAVAPPLPSPPGVSDESR